MSGAKDGPVLARQSEPPPSATLTVVVLSTSGEANVLERSLEALRRQTATGFTVHIARGTGSLFEMVRAAAAEIDTPLVLIVDDAQQLEPGLVAAHLDAHLPQGGPVLVAGPVEVVTEADAHPIALWEREAARRRTARLESSATLEPRDCRLTNVSVARDVLLQVGRITAETPRLAGVELGAELGMLGVGLRACPAARASTTFRLAAAAAATAVRREGAESVRLVRGNPSLLPELPLAELDGDDPLLTAVQRAVLALRLPRAALLALGGTMRSRAPWLTRGVLLWQGVRSEADRDMWRRLTRGPVVLMYHAFAVDGERPSRFVVSPRQLERQLRLARLLRRRVVPLDALVAARREHRPARPDSVAITIDDGYLDNLTVALPILLRRGAPATVFAVTGSDDARHDWVPDGPLAGRPMLDADGLRALAGAGVSIGAHTRTHPELTEVDDLCAEAEIAGSKAELEAILGRNVDVFAYPHGRTDSRIVDVVRRAGFEAAVGIQRGRNGAGTPLYALRRVEVDGRNSLFRFALTLLFGDPLLGARTWAAARGSLRGRQV